MEFLLDKRKKHAGRILVSASGLSFCNLLDVVAVEPHEYKTSYVSNLYVVYPQTRPCDCCKVHQIASIIRSRRQKCQVDSDWPDGLQKKFRSKMQSAFRDVGGRHKACSDT